MIIVGGETVMEGVTEYNEGHPVSLVADDDKIVIDAVVESGGRTEVDVLELIAWLKTNRPNLLKPMGGAPDWRGPFRWRDPTTGHWQFKDMKTSDLIAELQKAIDAHGDLPVSISSDGEYSIHEVTARDGRIYVSY